MRAGWLGRYDCKEGGREEGRHGDGELLHEDELVALGEPQAILLGAVLNDELAPAREQRFAADDALSRRVIGGRRRIRVGWRRINHGAVNLVKNNSHSHRRQTLAAIEDHLQQIF